MSWVWRMCFSFTISSLAWPAASVEKWVGHDSLVCSTTVEQSSKIHSHFITNGNIFSCYCHNWTFFAFLIVLPDNSFVLYLSALKSQDRSTAATAFLPVITLLLEYCSMSLPNLKGIEQKLNYIKTEKNILLSSLIFFFLNEPRRCSFPKFIILEVKWKSTEAWFCFEMSLSSM